jgi:hypothetical protein
LIDAIEEGSQGLAAVNGIDLVPQRIQEHHKTHSAEMEKRLRLEKINQNTRAANHAAEIEALEGKVQFHQEAAAMVQVLNSQLLCFHYAFLHHACILIANDLWSSFSKVPCCWLDCPVHERSVVCWFAVNAFLSEAQSTIAFVYLQGDRI